MAIIASQLHLLNNAYLSNNSKFTWFDQFIMHLSKLSISYTYGVFQNFDGLQKKGKS